jgi:hypothetical protein
MISKRLLRPDRRRVVPSQFSWVDHRLVRHQRLQGCDPAAWALYLFLVTVADAEGLSYYSDASLGRHLTLDALTLARARQQLLDAGLLAYEKPLYQVLGLDDPEPRSTSAQARSPPYPSAGSCAGRCRRSTSTPTSRSINPEQEDSAAQIARQLRLHPETVTVAGPPAEGAAPRRPTKLDASTPTSCLPSPASLHRPPDPQRLR